MGNDDILLESGTNEVELLTFNIDHQAFGINVAKVQSILMYEGIVLSEIPHVHPAMLGMMIYRERTIPLIELSKILDMTPAVSEEKQKIIVTEFNQAVNAFKVDHVNRIFRVNWRDFVPIGNILEYNSTAVIGTVNIDGNDVMILDMESMLEEIFPSLVIEEITNETLEKSETRKRENVHIIFAEDSRSIRNNVIRLLKEAGYSKVDPFESGFPAYEALLSLADKGAAYLPDVVVSDIEMPQMDGLTFCRKIKENADLKNIKVVMFSSLINAQMIEKCKSVNADSYVAKPQTNRLVEILDDMSL